MRNNRPEDVRLERIENGVGVGTPDVLMLCQGLVTWVELKAVEVTPVRATTPLLGNDALSIDQRNWHMSWWHNGGTSFFLIGVRATQYLLPGYAFDAVNKVTLDQLKRMSIGSDWPTIYERLKGY